MTEPLIIERRDGYAVCTLNRPEALNALSRSLLSALQNAIDDLEADPHVRAMIITGAGRAFCAGMDLKELSSDASQLTEKGGLWSEASLNPIRHLRTFSGPIVAAVNGAAVTGGFELALSSDVIYAAPEAKFADTHARVGIVPGGGVSQILSRLIGPYRARAYSLTGDFISAEQAERWGLVAKIVPAGELVPEAERLVRSMLEIEPDMLVTYKRLINDGYDRSFGEAMALEETVARAHANRTGKADIGARRNAIQSRGRSQTS